jgi:collagen triple helix repeat protein
MRISQLRPAGGVAGIIRPFSRVNEIPRQTPAFVPLCTFEQRPPVRPWILALLRTISCLRKVLRQATQQRRLKMKTLLMSALSLVLFVGGCNNSPAAPVPGPAGPQGQVGQTGQTGDTGHTGDRGRMGYNGDTGQAGQSGDRGETGDKGDRGRTGDSGQAGRTGDSGQAGRTGDQGAQGQAAPCPAGEHRSTDHDSGRASCVRD